MSALAAPLLTRAAAAAARAPPETIPTGSREYRPDYRFVIIDKTADEIVERFLDRMVAHDWDGMAACITDDVERTGPFCDVYRGKQDYVAFISGLLPSLPGYAMKVDRVVYAGKVAMAELTETVDGTDTPESLVFDLNEDGLIARISIYIQRPEFGME